MPEVIFKLSIIYRPTYTILMQPLRDRENFLPRRKSKDGLGYGIFTLTIRDWKAKLKLIGRVDKLNGFVVLQRL